jgi:ribosomal protein S21
MILEVKKGERETTQNLIRRFTKRIQKSGVLLKARENRFYKRSKSRQMKKKAALRREKLKQEYKKLEKLGKLGKY